MKTPITYYGGKQTLLKDILPLIPEHRVYTETFCGGAAVLFGKERAEVEVINDINMHITNFYWVAKVYYPDLKQEIEKTLYSRDIHEHARHILKFHQFFTPVQRAWAVWVSCNMSFAAKMGGSFGYNFKGNLPRKITKAKDHFTEELCKRLERVTIENRDALNVISTYDFTDAFHFVDPPYINSTCAHYAGYFNESDLKALLELLKDIKGKFMLTMFPLPILEDHAVKHGWIIHRIQRSICVEKKNTRKQEEWIVCNYKLVNSGDSKG